MKITRFVFPFAVIGVLLVPGIILAEGAKSSSHHDMHSKKNESDKGGSHKKGHHFTDGWSATLNDDQKLRVDMMHLKLDRELIVLKAQADLVQKEINVLTAQDNANMKAIHAKINELMDINHQIMRARYAHILEMRAALTADQRITYDMMVLKRSGIK